MTGNAEVRRETAGERRQELLEAALAEFAEHGYQGASTARIAKRAGISQPYIYALFPNKRELFLAVHGRVMEAIRVRFAEAVRGAVGPTDALHRMGETYPSLIADRLALLCQLQCYAASGEAEIREPVAAAFRSLFEQVQLWSGATAAQVANFFAQGMLANVTTILDLPDLCSPLFEDRK